MFFHLFARNFYLIAHLVGSSYIQPMILFSSICISGIPSSIPDLHVVVLFYPGLFELGCMHIILHKWADEPRVLPARTSTRSVQLHASTLPFLPHTRLHPPIDREENNGDGGGEESPPNPPPHPGSASRCSRKNALCVRYIFTARGRESHCGQP